MQFNPLSAKFTKWSNTLNQIVGKLPTICLSVFDHFSGLALKGLTLLFHILQTLAKFFNKFLPKCSTDLSKKSLNLYCFNQAGELFMLLYFPLD